MIQDLNEECDSQSTGALVFAIIATAFIIDYRFRCVRAFKMSNLVCKSKPTDTCTLNHKTVNDPLKE